jgi:hypothetical protein
MDATRRALVPACARTSRRCDALACRLLNGAVMNVSAQLGSLQCVTGLACIALSYVKTGTREPPAGSNATTDMIDVIERRPLAGKLRVRVTFFEQMGCRDPKEAALELDIPR